MADEPRVVTIGQCVNFHDERGRRHDALITAIHGDADRCPCINLLIVSSDNTKHDDYGRQIERPSSVVHQRDNTAHGYYWRFDEDPINPVNANTQI